MPRILSAKPDSRLIPLPWQTPLAQWPEDHLVALPRGISRHVVRFIKVGNDVYAAKEVIEAAAVHEYRMLQELAREEGTPLDQMAVLYRIHAMSPVLEAALGWTLCVTGGGLLLAGSQYRAEGNHGRQHATAK